MPSDVTIIMRMTPFIWRTWSLYDLLWSCSFANLGINCTLDLDSAKGICVRHVRLFTFKTVLSEPGNCMSRIFTADFG